MIVVLCGPPASGKTTLATGLADRLADRGREFELLHSDDFRRRTYDRMYEVVAGTGADWILDGTFYDRADQERFRALADAHLVWVRAEKGTALARNESREESIAETGIHVMHAKFEEPDADLLLDTDDLSEAEALDCLEAAVLEWLGRE